MSAARTEQTDPWVKGQHAGRHAGGGRARRRRMSGARGPAAATAALAKRGGGCKRAGARTRPPPHERAGAPQVPGTARRQTERAGAPAGAPGAWPRVAGPSPPPPHTHPPSPQPPQAIAGSHYSLKMPSMLRFLVLIYLLFQARARAQPTLSGAHSFISRPPPPLSRAPPHRQRLAARARRWRCCPHARCGRWAAG